MRRNFDNIKRKAWLPGLIGLAMALAASWAGCGGDSSTGGSGSNDGGSAGSAGTGGSGGNAVCGPGTTECAGQCVDTQFDPANCGACGTMCATGELCSVGQCDVQCLGGSTQCANQCVDLNNDPANCGACGTACATIEVCTQGTCSSSCLGGTTQCGAACVDLNNDPANCGSCGTACAAGEVCANGNCGFTCVGGTVQCGNLCADLNNDPANCGACGTLCAAGTVCSMGSCGITCLGGSTQCGNACVDVNTNPAHCGMCNNACAAGQYCSGGSCIATGSCGAGQTLCNGVCVNLQNNAQNCGSCSNACVGTGASCLGGSCVPCNSNTTDCDGDGWLVADGDCCDQSGLCGSQPELVNPGAIEVVGNGIDDNCNNQTDLFDTSDTVACDAGLTSNSNNPIDYAKALGVCRQTTLNPPLNQKTWGLISAQLLRADGSPLGDNNSKSIRTSFGSVMPAVLQGSSMVVLSSGLAADATQTNPGPNGGAPAGFNVSNVHTPASNVNIGAAGMQYSVNDWYATPNLPLKPANGLPDSPGCNASNVTAAQDSVMFVMTLRAPTNAKAFSFNSYFFSAEYPEYVCTNFNDQYIALVDTPSGVPSPIPNPVDKNLMVYTSMNQKWPIGINIAKGTSLFSVCESQAANPGCWDTDVSATSCSLGLAQLTGTGFDKTGGMGCLIGGGTFWLTTSGNVIPGQLVTVRIVIWDVGDANFDSSALIDGFQWLSNATLPGTG